MAHTKSAENELDPATGKPLPAGVQYRGPLQYRARKLIKGKRVAQTFESARRAREWLEATSAKLCEGSYVNRSPLEQWTGGALVKRFNDEVLVVGGERRGAAEDRAHIPAILADQALCGLKLSDMDAAAVQEFRDRHVKRYAKSTVAKRMNLLQQAFATAARTWRILLSANPASGELAPRPKGADKKRSRTLFVPGVWEQQRSPELGKGEFPTEHEVLLEVLKTSDCAHDARIAEFAIEQAARQGECLGLRWRDVDLGRRTITLHGRALQAADAAMTEAGKRRRPRRATQGTKSGDQREELAAEVRTLVPGALAVLLDIQKHIERVDRDAMIFQVGGYQAFRVRWGRIVRKAAAKMTGLKKELGYLANLRFHDLRQESTTKLSELFPRNMDFMAVTGHRDTKSLKRYYNRRPEDLAAQADAMMRALELMKQEREAEKKL